MEDEISIDDISWGNVDRILDDSESRVSCGHWANTGGTRVYDRNRVRRAESVQYIDGEYRHADADEINMDPRPCTLPILVVDYRHPLEHIDCDLERKIGSSRMSHPFAGRMPGSEERERALVIQALATLINFVDAEAILGSLEEVGAWFDGRSLKAAERLGAPWPQVLCRKVNLRTYLSRAKSKRAVARMLDAFSLVHVAQVPTILSCEKPEGVVDLLVAAPVVRFDHVVKKIAK